MTIFPPYNKVIYPHLNNYARNLSRVVDEAYLPLFSMNLKVYIRLCFVAVEIIKSAKKSRLYYYKM